MHTSHSFTCDTGAHQLAIRNRPGRNPAQRFLLEQTHRRAEKIGAIPVQLDRVWYGKTRDGSNECKQDLHPEAVAAIEDRKAHDQVLSVSGARRRARTWS
jgi:hypothetical protein